VRKVDRRARSNPLPRVLAADEHNLLLALSLLARGLSDPQSLDRSALRRESEVENSREPGVHAREVGQKRVLVVERSVGGVKRVRQRDRPSLAYIAGPNVRLRSGSVDEGIFDRGDERAGVEPLGVDGVQVEVFPLPDGVGRGSLRARKQDVYMGRGGRPDVQTIGL
jgi:hypothetical protein